MILAIGYIFSSCPLRVVFLFVIISLQGVIPALNVYITGQIINTLQRSNIENVSLIPSVVLWCLSIFLTQLIQPLVNLVRGDIAEISTHYFNEKIISRVNGFFTLNAFDNKHYHERLELLKREAPFRPLNFIVSVICVFRALISFAGLLFVLIKYSAAGAAVCAISSVPLIIANVIIEKKNWENSLRNSKDALVMRYIYDVCMNKNYLQEIRLYGIGGFLLNKHNVAAKKMYSRMHKQRIRSLITPIPAIILSLLVLASGVCFFINALRNNNLSVGSIVIAFQSIVMMKVHLDELAIYGAALNSSGGFFRSYHSFMTENIEHVRNGGVILKSDHPIDIKIRNLSFRYNGKNRSSLKNISLDIPSGQKIAILGENGSGKTTLIKLLLRMYTAEENSIFISGIPVEKLNIDKYRAQVSTVFQEYGKYEFNVRENVSLSEHNDKNDEILEGILEQVKLPCFPEMELGKQFGGNELSTGQWQKLAIARALFRKANLFIFDEFSSSLDSELERDLFSKILSLNATVIAITHRLGKIKEFDRILVMAGGEVVEDGDFDTLFKKEGRFYRMWTAQFQSVIKET